ncbi:MAG: hypothetical protein SVU32_09540 [Candidatus Nanohaloarchaea archaeon]|nr:hypothetical protein [Candidatus Nanohaloarchaea archaeon]
MDEADEELMSMFSTVGQEGMDDLAMEYIAVDYSEFYDTDRRRSERYDLDGHRETFRDRVTAFLQEHEIVDVDITVDVDHKSRNRVRDYEAWVVYRDD